MSTLLIILLGYCVIHPCVADNKDTNITKSLKAWPTTKRLAATSGTQQPPANTKPVIAQQNWPTTKRSAETRNAQQQQPAHREPDAAQEPPLYIIDTPMTPLPPLQSRLGQILKAQMLRVCVRTDLPPFGEFIGHNLSGFDIDLAREVVAQLSIYYKKNINLSWVVLHTDMQIYGLLRDHCDMVIATVYEHPAHKTHISYSEIYLSIDRVLLKKLKITRENPVIAAIESTTDGLKIKGKVKIFRDYKQLIDAMDKGHVDYVVTGQPIAIHLLSKVSESFLIEQDPNKTTEYSIGVPKKSVFLLQAINRTLLDLARSGRLAYLQRQWL